MARSGTTEAGRRQSTRAATQRTQPRGLGWRSLRRPLVDVAFSWVPLFAPPTPPPPKLPSPPLARGPLLFVPAVHTSVHPASRPLNLSSHPFVSSYFFLSFSTSFFPHSSILFLHSLLCFRCSSLSLYSSFLLMASPIFSVSLPPPTSLPVVHHLTCRPSSSPSSQYQSSQSTSSPPLSYPSFTLFPFPFLSSHSSSHVASRTLFCLLTILPVSSLHHLSLSSLLHSLFYIPFPFRSFQSSSQLASPTLISPPSPSSSSFQSSLPPSLPRVVNRKPYDPLRLRTNAHSYQLPAQCKSFRDGDLFPSPSLTAAPDYPRR